MSSLVITIDGLPSITPEQFRVMMSEHDGWTRMTVNSDVYGSTYIRGLDTEGYTFLKNRDFFVRMRSVDMPLKVNKIMDSEGEMLLYGRPLFRQVRIGDFTCPSDNIAAMLILDEVNE